MCAGKKIVSNNFAREGEQLIGQSDHVVAIPTNPAADMQQNFGNVKENTRELVSNAFGRVEMAGIKAEELLARNGVAKVEFVRAHDVAFAADTEELRFNRVEVMAG